MGLVPEEPGLSGEIAGQRELLSRLRAVVEAKDAEIAVLRRELDAERELRRRLELRLAELERRLSMDSSDSGTPSVEGADRGERGAAGAAAVGAGAPQGPQAGRAARAPGQGPGSGIRTRMRRRTRSRRRSAAAAGRAWTARRPRAAVGAGHRRGDHPEGDRVGAAGPGVPVLRDGHVRGAAAWRARRARCPTGRC